MDKEGRERFVKEVAKNRGRGGVWFTLQKGDNKLRLVGDYEKIETHYLGDLLNKLSDSGDIDFPRSVACGDHFAKPCPFCAYAKKQLSSSDEEDQALSVKMKAKPRYFWNTIVRVEDVPVSKVVEIGPQAFKELGVVFDDWGDFTDPKNGYCVVINVGEEGGWTKYRAKAEMMKERLASGKEVNVMKETPLTEEEISVPLNALETIKTFPSEEDLSSFFEDIVGVTIESLGMRKRVSKVEPEVPAAVVQDKQPSSETPVPLTPSVSEKNYKKCFGSYDASDKELCGKCSDKEVCATKSGYTKGIGA